MTSHAEIVAVTNRALGNILLYPVPAPSETFLYRYLLQPKEPSVVQSDDGPVNSASASREILGHADAISPLRAYRAECEEAIKQEAEFRSQADKSVEDSQVRVHDLANRISELDASITALLKAPLVPAPTRVPSSPQAASPSPDRVWLSEAAYDMIRDNLAIEGFAVLQRVAQIIADTLHVIALRKALSPEMLYAGIRAHGSLWRDDLSHAEAERIYRAMRALERL